MRYIRYKNDIPLEFFCNLPLNLHIQLTLSYTLASPTFFPLTYLEHSKLNLNSNEAFLIPHLSVFNTVPSHTLSQPYLNLKFKLYLVSSYKICLTLLLYRHSTISKTHNYRIWIWISNMFLSPHLRQSLSNTPSSHIHTTSIFWFSKLGGKVLLNPCGTLLDKPLVHWFFSFSFKWTKSPNI